MAAVAGEGVEIEGEGGDKGLALPGLHLGDAAGVQDDAAHELDVEGPHAQGAPGALAGDGEGLDEEIVEGLVLGEALLELLGLLAELVVGESLGLRLEGVNAANEAGQVLWGQPNTAGRGSVQAGTLEMSNVDLALEFTQMIVAQRGFQANSKVISTSDEMLQELVNLKR